MMHTNGNRAPDPLLLLRESATKQTPPLLTNTEDASLASDAATLETAQYLLFNTQAPGSDVSHVSIPLTTSTRFISSRDEKPLDLLSVYLSWTNRDTSLTEYIAAVQALNAARTANGLGTVTKVSFTERGDLASWLSGENEESEFITPIDADQAKAAAAGVAAAIGKGGPGDDNAAATAMDASMADTNATGLSAQARGEEERTRAIHRLERPLGDRNTILRGIKPTDFSHVRKLAASLLRSRNGADGGAHAVAPMAGGGLSAAAAVAGGGGGGVGAVAGKGKARRTEPIILLSPSASSLLRLSNIKSFLQEGLYTSASSSNTGATMLHITRTLPAIDASRPLRFILVEGPENFKPDYWSRVVAVFTTGQAWQFKGYKWQQPAELFEHALGVYVGWRGETVPDTVKGWGRAVLSVQVDKWRDGQTVQQRWRDREVVEEIWGAVEAGMRSRGWAREGVR